MSSNQLGFDILHVIAIVTTLLVPVFCYRRKWITLFINQIALGLILSCWLISSIDDNSILGFNVVFLSFIFIWTISVKLLHRYGKSVNKVILIITSTYCVQFLIYEFLVPFPFFHNIHYLLPFFGILKYSGYTITSLFLIPFLTVTSFFSIRLYILILLIISISSILPAYTLDELESAPLSFQHKDETLRLKHVLESASSSKRDDFLVFPEVFLKTTSLDYFLGNDSQMKRIKEFITGRKGSIVLGLGTSEGLNYACVIHNDSNYIIEKAHYLPVSEWRISSFKDILDYYQHKANSKTINSSIGKINIQICYDISFMPTTKDKVIHLTEEHFFNRSFGQYLYLWHSINYAVLTNSIVIRSSNWGWSGTIYPVNYEPIL